MCGTLASMDNKDAHGAWLIAQIRRLAESISQAFDPYAQARLREKERDMTAIQQGAQSARDDWTVGAINILAMYSEDAFSRGYRAEKSRLLAKDSLTPGLTPGPQCPRVRT